MRVLALEPYYGGSHQAFLDGWRNHSAHSFAVRGLPAYKWKWRMRHAAVTFADALRQAPPGSADVLWVSDMLNLAEFVGLAPRWVQSLPRLLYFHENQLTYPVRHASERDLHYAFTNLTSALAADVVWFNSTYHRCDFLKALESYLARMPDHVPTDAVSRIVAKSRVAHPGISATGAVPREPGPCRICWNARWEHDKNPEDFFAAVRELNATGAEFRLIVLGQQFGTQPDVFARAEREFATRIDHWGFAPLEEYHGLLQRADVVVSTAHHEFFGLAVVEAMAAGVVPLLPLRLAYPEVLEAAGLPVSEHTYDGTVGGLVESLRTRVRISSSQWEVKRQEMAQVTACFDWAHRAAWLDQQLEKDLAECRSESEKR